ncbi:hypothetical protein [Halobacterium yunchengense]|uniref:hypothetical protein n=1 Tax=Halobacterium yunchengense TaxID=3108497 RepID=UPI003008DCC0
MRTLPPPVDVADAPASLLDGHLWLQEYVPGGWLRVQLRESGRLAFGDENRAFGGDPPPGFRAALRHVRASFDRDALRAALADVETATFFGLATRFEGLDYDWARVPPFLLVDVHDAEGDRFLPPDAVDALADRLGLAGLPAVAKEVRGADFDPARHDCPPSAYRDGEAAGVVVRNKTGDRGLLRCALDGDRRDGVVSDGRDHGTGDVSAEAAPFGDAAAAADALVTAERVDRAAAAATGGLDEVTERVFELVAREGYARLFGDRASVDADALRRAVGERTRRHFGAA